MLGIVGLLFSGCSPYHQGVIVTGPGLRDANAPITPLRFANDDVDDGFRTNTLVGNTTLSGGFTTIDDGRGLHNVSVDIKTREQERYRNWVKRWGATALPSSHQPVAASLQFDERRGSTPADGSDDVSLPRTAASPSPLVEPPGTAVVVPWVIRYETHNGGWYYGQKYGTPAGARFVLLVVGYDANGNVDGWTQIDAYRRSRRDYSLDGPALQDLLLWTEEKVSSSIAR